MKPTEKTIRLEAQFNRISKRRDKKDFQTPGSSSVRTLSAIQDKPSPLQDKETKFKVKH